MFLFLGLDQYESVELLDRRAATWKRAGPNPASAKNKNAKPLKVPDDLKQEYKRRMSDQLVGKGEILNMYGSRTGHAMTVYRVNFAGNDMSVTFKDSRSLHSRKAGDQAPKPNTGSKKEIGLQENGKPIDMPQEKNWVYPTYDIKFVVDLHAICLKQGQDHLSEAVRREGIRTLTMHYIDSMQRDEYPIQDVVLQYEPGDTVEIKLDYLVEDSNLPLNQKTKETYDGTLFPADTRFRVVRRNFTRADEEDEAKPDRQYIQVEPVSAGDFPNFKPHTIIRADYFRCFRQGDSVVLVDNFDNIKAGVSGSVTEVGPTDAEVKFTFSHHLSHQQASELFDGDLELESIVHTTRTRNFQGKHQVPEGHECKVTKLWEDGGVTVQIVYSLRIELSLLRFQ